MTTTGTLSVPTVVGDATLAGILVGSMPLHLEPPIVVDIDRFNQPAGEFSASWQTDRGAHPDKITALPSEEASEFELLQPIPVEFTYVSGGLAATVPGTDLIAHGETYQDAQENLLAWMLDLYDELDGADRATLPPRLVGYVDALGRYLRRPE